MDWTLFAIFFVATAAAGSTGMIFHPGSWYDGLQKPRWTPKPWVFPVVWTTLYILIAVAGARLAGVPGAGMALAFWAAQIAFNTLWTPVFFGAHRMRLAMGVMVFLWFSVAGLVREAFALDLWSGVMLVPYLVWVSIAAALNFEVLRLNRWGRDAKAAEVSASGHSPE